MNSGRSSPMSGKPRPVGLRKSEDDHTPTCPCRFLLSWLSRETGSNKKAIKRLDQEGNALQNANPTITREVLTVWEVLSFSLRRAWGRGGRSSGKAPPSNSGPMACLPTYAHVKVASVNVLPLVGRWSKGTGRGAPHLLRGPSPCWSANSLRVSAPRMRAEPVVQL